MESDLRATTLYDKALACLLGGLVGDAMGTPSEGIHYREIQERFGWIDDFEGSGTDDTVMKDLLSQALVATGGYATLDDWAQAWLDDWQAIFGPKVNKFFISVLHTAQKVRRHSLPRMAALGNMPSSSSAMAISPVGIVNACNPRQAALQAYNLASLIHIHDVAFCTDGAAAMAAAVAAAFLPGADVNAVLQAASDAILPLSGQEMRQRIAEALALACAAGDYHAFRTMIYAQDERFFCRIQCDSRETIPLTLALFQLAGGDVGKAVAYGANLGRDADTIATMAGALAGALQGMNGIKDAWRAKLGEEVLDQQARWAVALAQAALEKASRERQAGDALRGIAG